MVLAALALAVGDLEAVAVSHKPSESLEKS